MADEVANVPADNNWRVRVSVRVEGVTQSAESWWLDRMSAPYVSVPAEDLVSLGEMLQRRISGLLEDLRQERESSIVSDEARYLERLAERRRLRRRLREVIEGGGDHADR